MVEYTVLGLCIGLNIGFLLILTGMIWDLYFSGYTLYYFIEALDKAIAAATLKQETGETAFAARRYRQPGDR
jgi:hypothetical protein